MLFPTISRPASPIAPTMVFRICYRRGDAPPTGAASPRRFKSLPSEVLKRYEKWKDIVSISGSNGLRAICGFYDEALGGQWKGFRSSRLGLKYRLIYKIEVTKVLVKVIDLTPHDYRKK